MLNVDELLERDEFTNSSAFWENMNKLLDVKFNNFGQSIKDSILGEVKQIKNRKYETQNRSYVTESEGKGARRKNRDSTERTPKNSFS